MNCMARILLCFEWLLLLRATPSAIYAPILTKIKEAMKNVLV